MSIITNLVRKTKLGGSARILSLFYDGYFEWQLAQTDAQIYGYRESAIYNWPDTIPLNNIHFLSAPLKNKGNNYEFDFIICNNRIKQYDRAKKISDMLHLPLLLVDHEALTDELSGVDQYVLTENRKANYSVATNKQAKDDWKANEYILPFIEVTEPEEKDINVLIGGRFIKEEYGLIERLLTLENSRAVGPNPGLSNEFGDLQEFNETFALSKIFINLSTTHSLNPYLLQAMASGCTIISNDVPLIRNLLGENAIYTKDPNNIPSLVKSLLNNSKRRQVLGNEVKKIAKEFTKQSFVNKWNNVIEHMKKEIYLPCI